MHIPRETIGKNCLQITWSDQAHTWEVSNWPPHLPSLLSCIKAFKWFWWAKLPWCNNIYHSYGRGWFGSLFAMGSSFPLLEQNSNWCHQEKWLLAAPPILMDWRQIHSTAYELWSSPCSKTCWHRWEMTKPNPKKGLVGWEHSPLAARWALKDQGQGQAVGHNGGWPITSISYKPHAFPHPSCAHPHSVQSRVVQAKQNNLTSETRIR